QSAAASRDATQRNALALGASGGASGIRAALSGSIAANQQTAQQQAITQAQEFNQLQAMKQQGLATAGGLRQQGLTAASGIRSGLGAQDQSAAQLAQAVRAQAGTNQLAGMTSQA